MSKGLRLAAAVVAGFFCLTLLHVWLNVGFDKFNFLRRGDAVREKMLVGFLPVT